MTAQRPFERVSRQKLAIRIRTNPGGVGAMVPETYGFTRFRYCSNPNPCVRAPAPGFFAPAFSFRGLLEGNPEQSLRGVSAARGPIEPFTIFGDPCRCAIRNVIKKFRYLARRRYPHHRHSARYVKRAVRRNGKIIGTDTLREQHGTAFRLTIRIHLNAVEFVDTSHVYPAIVHLDPVLPRKQ